MNPSDRSRDGEPQASEAPADSARPVGRSRRRVIVGSTVGAVLGILALAVAFDLLTAVPRLCWTCHEIELRAAEWHETPHREVACVRCHTDPTEWYELPKRAVDRVRLYGGDIVAHVSGDYEDPVDSRPPGTPPMKDEVCLQCHSPNRRATSGFRILIDHPEHAKRNGSCLSCHLRTGHNVETRSAAISLMAQCFTCHGTPEKPEASAECSVCHPSGYELVPASHKRRGWKSSNHGEVLASDRTQCMLCHEQKVCDDCHGLRMPHPAGWEKGRTGHSRVAKTNRAVCTRCHDEPPEWCAMCHHRDYDPSKGGWVKQHYLVARTRGAVFCLDCHSPTFCADCHVRMPQTD